METNRQADRERTETNHDDLIKTVKEEMRAMVDACHKEMMACLGKTEADREKPDPDLGMMQSAEEHQEFTKKDAAVIPVGEPRKRRRVRNLAAERRQKQKERIRTTCESRRKSAATCRKVYRRAKVAWRKRNLIRKSGTQENCGPLQEFSPSGMRTTRCAKVARRKGRSYEEPTVEQGRRKNKNEDKISRVTRGRRMLGRRKVMCQGGTNGTGNRGFIEQLCLKNERTSEELDRKTFGLEFVKRAFGISGGLQRLMDRTLWRGRPPPKRKKKLKV
jgi:hypothetical protein